MISTKKFHFTFQGLTLLILYYARQSLDPQFDHIDTGNDDMLNRILWFSARGKQSYPAKYAGGVNEDDDDVKKRTTE